MEPQRGFDGREMVVIHTMFRREFGLMPDLVRAVPAGDRERAALVGDHIDFVSTILHHHHRAEHEGTWPLLLERCPEEIPALVQLMEAQHANVAIISRQVRGALALLRASASAMDRALAAGALDRLVPALFEHLNVEEERVVPVMERHITMSEWKDILAKATAHADQESLRLGLGMVLYEADPGMIGEILATVPARLRPVIWQRATQAFADHSERIHGTAIPPRSTEL